MTDRPSLVIVRSHIGYGSPNKQDTHSAHGSPLGEDEVKATKEVYGWPPDETFYVPDERARALRRGGRARQRAGDASGRSGWPRSASRTPTRRASST